MESPLKEKIEKVVRDLEPSYFARLMKNVNKKINKAAQSEVHTVFQTFHLRCSLCKSSLANCQ